MFILGILVGVVITAVIVVGLYIKYFYRDPDAPIGDMEYWSTDNTPEHKINIINRFIKRRIGE